MSIKIFINPTADGDAALGACDRVRVTSMPEWVSDVVRGKSAAATFIHTALDGDGDTRDDIEALDAAVKLRTDYEALIASLIADSTEVEMRIGTINGPEVEAVPLDAAMCAFGTRFTMPLNEYNLRHRARLGDLKEGSTVIGRVVEADFPKVRWTFVRKVSSEIERGDAAEYAARRRISRIYRELGMQGGKVFLQCRITDTQTDGSGSGTTEHYRVRFQDVEPFGWPYVSDIDRDVELPDGSILMHLQSAQRRDTRVMLKLTTSWGRSYGLPFSPEEGFGTRDISGVEGRPHRFNNGKNLVTVLFDGATWRSGVFSNYILGPIYVSDIDAYRQAAYRYIVPGYPCTFALDINPNSPDKTRLLLSGIAPSLEGRLRSNIDIRHLKEGPLASDVPMAPAGLCDGNIRMVSAGYTAFMRLGDAPKALRHMAGAGIFSPDFTVRCDLQIVATGPGKWLVRCRPAAPDSLPRPGAPVGARLCAALDGVLYLMADGGIPAMCAVEEPDAELAILDGSTRVDWIVKESDSRGSITLTAVSRHEDAADMDTVPGFSDIFRIGSDMTYHGLQVLNLPAGTDVPGDTAMLCLLRRLEDGVILATADIASLSSSYARSMERLELLPDGLDFGLLIGRRQVDKRLLSARLDSAVDRIILARLADLYGAAATFVGSQSPQQSFRPHQTRWTGIACHHDYSALRGDIDPDVASLWQGLDPDTPVLFGDICIARADLPELPALSADGVTAPEPAAAGLYTVAAVSPAKLAVTLVRDGHEIILAGGEQLRLPFPRGKRAATVTPLDRIFAVGSAWALDADEGCLRTDDSDTPRVYTLVAPLRQTAGSDWVVRGDDGSIAVAADLDSPTPGRRLLMTTDNVLGPFVYVEEAEEHFVGRKLRLAVTEVTEAALVCRELSGAVTRRIELPIGLVSWNHSWTPRRIAPGTVLSARVIEAEPDRLVVDRRCLLRQDALLPGIRPEGGRLYQMEVAGIAPGGYVLSQNGVEALLPFACAALFDITPRNLSYLRPDDCIAVKISRRGDSLIADWAGDKVKVARAWAAERVMLPFTVHHHCPDGIFVEREGIVMYVSNRALGYWGGRSLESEYAPGSAMLLRVTETAPGRFGLGQAGVSAPAEPAPAVGAVYGGIVTDILSEVGCYVRHADGWGAFVPANAITRLPRSRDGRPGVNVGDTVRFAVTAVDHVKGSITGDISATQPLPESGPGSAVDFVDAVGEVISNDATRMVLADTRGYLATIVYDEADTPVMVEAVVSGLGCVMVTGMRPDGTMAASAAALRKANDAFAAEFKKTKAASGEPTIIEAEVIGHSRKSVYLRHGTAMGLMPRAECDIPAGTPLAETFPVGSRVTALVYSIAYECAFTASVLRLRRMKAAAAAAAYQPGTRLRIRITGTDADGVHGRAGDLDVLIPPDELCLAPGVTPAIWAESRTQVDVVATGLSPDTVLIASRRRYLGDIPER